MKYPKISFLWILFAFQMDARNNSILCRQQAARPIPKYILNGGLIKSKYHLPPGSTRTTWGEGTTLTVLASGAAANTGRIIGGEGYAFDIIQ